MSELRRGIDEVERDLLSGRNGSLRMERLSESDGSLLASHDTSLQHQPVVLDNTIVGESTERSNRFRRQVDLGRSGLGITGLTDSVDLLIHLGTVMVSVLSGTCHRERHSRRMPGSDTGNLTKTSVGLSRETRGSPTSGDTLVSFSFRDTDDVDHLVLGEDGIDGNLALEKRLRKGDLVINTSTVDLNLNNVCLALTKVELGHLSVSDDSHDGAVPVG